MEVRVEYDYEAQEKDELNLVKGEIINNVVPKIDGWFEGTLKNGKRGLFPDNFVVPVPIKSSNLSSNTADEVFTDQTVQLRKSPNPNSKRYKTLFSYSPEQEDELRLEVGDIVEFIDIVEEGWFRGRGKGGKIGIFPSNFVSEVVDEDKKEAKAKTNILNSRADSFSKSKENRPLSKIAQNKPDVVPDTKLKKEEEVEEPAPKLPPKPVRELARCFYPYLALNDDELTMNEGDIITIISRNCEDEGWFRGELKGKVGLFPDNFVKMLTPNEVKMLNINSNSMNEISSISVNQPKIRAQERSVKKEIVSTTSRLSIGNDDVSDGSKSSKLNDSNNSSGKLKKESSFPLAKELVGKPLGQIISRFSYKEKDTSKDKDSYTGGAVPQKPNSNSSSPSNIIVKRESNSSFGSNSVDVDEDDFNFVERGEMLNQLNAERAKPPKKRRPPSAIIKENGHGLMNGTSNSLEQSEINTSPIVNHTTAINNSTSMITSTSTPPTSLVLDTSSKENTSSTAISPTSTKPKETTPKIAPWMAELREKQKDKKRETTPTFEKSPSLGSPTSSTTSVVPPMTITRKEPIRAPPLPQKPQPNSNNTSLADISNTSSTSAVVTPPTTTHFPSTKFGKRPSPVSSPVTSTPPLPPSSTSLVTTTSTSTYINSNSNTTSYNSSSTMPMTMTDGNSLPSDNISMSNGTGATVVSINNKQFVSIEEFSKLKDRVSLLEGELDLLRKQMRLLLDRDMTKGHIV